MIEGFTAMNEDLDDASFVLEFALDAGERNDESSLIELFDAASQKLTTQTIVNVLSATNWLGQTPLFNFLGWKAIEPSIVLEQRRADFVDLVSKWLTEHEPARRLDLLRGLVKGIE
jgi:hypothetical protein